MIATVALAAAISNCSWDRPGANRYIGDVPSAVQRYSEIPKVDRDRLQERMTKHQYDDIAEIKKDTIQGKREYSDLRSMHFGKNQVCGTVTRAAWKPEMVERGLVYCEGNHCVIVPTVCGNVSLVTRSSRPAAATSTAAAAAAPSVEPIIITPAAGPTQDGGSGESVTGAGPVIGAPGGSFESGSFPSGPANPSFPIIQPNFPYLPPGNIPTSPVPLPAVPEPSSLILFFIGFIFLAIKVLRGKKI